MKELKGGSHEKKIGGQEIQEEISMRCQRQRDKLARQRERLKKQRLRIAERVVAGLANPEDVSQRMIDDVAYSLLETLDDF